MQEQAKNWYRNHAENETRKKSAQKNSQKNATKGDKQNLKENGKTMKEQEKWHYKCFIFVAYGIKNEQKSFDIW